MLDWIANPESWAALLTLTLLEVVLGIDNIIMISVLADRLPEERRPFARKMGLALALVTRLALLFSLAWLIGLTDPLVEVLGEELSGRDLILMAGGLFLLVKATREIHTEIEEAGHREPSSWADALWAVLAQIALLDVVFSLDSVITAVGMANEIFVMATAIIVAVVVMIVLIGPISRFITHHPTLKMLAFAFLILIGVTLIAESLDQHLPKPYLYFAFGFSLGVEMLNMLRRSAKGDAREGAPPPRRPGVDPATEGQASPAEPPAR